MLSKLKFFVAMVLISLFAISGAWAQSYVKVTEAPEDWSGDYLLVYENSDTSAYVWTGVDAANSYDEAIISDNAISLVPDNACTITIESMEGGYSILVNGGTNDGKYISGVSASNTISFGTSAVLNTIGYESGSTVITSNTSVLRFNSANNNLRFRYFKSSSYTSQKVVQLYKFSTQATVSAPVFSLEEGTYFGAQNVTITCATEGATIYYTLDGTEPTATSTEYTAPVAITETATLKAIAVLGEDASSVTSATYTISSTPMTENPVFSVAAGSYYDIFNLTISCATEGASIYYTLDGTDPTAESILYEGPIEINVTTTVKAIALKEGNTNSEVVSATYTLPIFVENIAAFLASETTTSSTVYKITGDITFVYRGTGDTRYIYVKDETASMLVYASGSSYFTSEYVEGDVISGGIVGTYTKYNNLVEFVPKSDPAPSTVNNGPVAPVTITMEQLLTGNYMSQLVKIQDVHFTTTVTFSTSSATNANFTDDVNTAVCRNQFKSLSATYAPADVVDIIGFAAVNNSNIQVYPRSNADVAVKTYAANPTFSPEGGVYSEAQTVTIACETEGASIYYTLDGTEPTDASTLYVNPLTISETTTVKAIAYAEGTLASEVVTATYTISALEQVETPTFSIAAGTYDDAATFTIACATEEAVIYYTLDGTEPTEESTVYTSEITVTETCVVKAIAYKAGMIASEIASLSLTINTIEYATIPFEWTSEYGTTPTGVVKYSLGTYNTTNVVALKFDGTNDSLIIRYNGTPGLLRFTLGNGSGFTGTLVNNMVFTVYQYVNGESSVVRQFVGGDEYGTFEYELAENSNMVVFKFDNKVTGTNASLKDIYITAPTVANPVFSPEGGTFNETQTVTITCATSNAVIYYTTDESEPTATSTQYENPITVAETTTIKAKAIKGELESETVTAVYTITNMEIAAAPVFSIANGTYEDAATFTITTETEDANIYYTLDGTDPTAESTLYTDEITVTSTCVVKAITIKAGMFDSQIATLNITIVTYEYADLPFDWTDDYGTAPTGVVNVGVSTYNGALKFDQALDSLIIRYHGVADSIRYTVMPNNNSTATFNDGTVFTATQYANGVATNVQTVTEATEAGTYTFDMAHESNMVVFKFANKASGTNIALKDIHIYPYTDPATTVFPPAFSHATGIYDGTINVEITCQTEGSTIYYTIDGTEPTNASTLYTEPIAISENTTIKAIAYKEGFTTSTVSSATYTFSVVCANIAEFLEMGAAAGDNTIIYNIASEITYIYRGVHDTRYMYVKDATAGLLIYDSQRIITTAYEMGDTFTGLKGKYSPYNGLVEFVPVENTSAATGNVDVTAIITTIEEMSTYDAQFVELVNVTFDYGAEFTNDNAGTAMISQNGSTINCKNVFKDVNATLTEGAQADVRGFVAYQNGEWQLYLYDYELKTSIENGVSEIAIYPNPTTNFVNVELNGLNARNIEIVNVNGQVVMSEEVNDVNTVISLESQSEGMYFLRIYTDDEVIVRKITKF